MKLSLRIGLFFAISVVVACSPTRDTYFNRKYHNLLARDNTYFNASERFRNTVLDIEKSHKDNYLEILEVFPYADENAGKAVAPILEEILKKSSRVINDHPISKWVDDSWMLVGKSHFFKRDFFAAIETFQYISSRLKKSELRFEASVWTVKSYLQQGKISDAEALLGNMKNEKIIPKYILGEYNATSAWMLIKQAKYSSAIINLKTAIENTRKKNKRIRYTFILAQLLQHEGKFAEARAAYKKVMKMNPPYEFAFNARINLSRSYDFNDPSTVREARAFLKKMARDEKNKSFLDQIYFELGNLEMKVGNTEEAIKYYSLSAAHSTANPNQKALTFLKLADIYFSRPDYPKAQAFYDSTVIFLKSDYPDYRKINDKKEVLSELIANIIVRDQENNQQKLASMDSVSLRKAVDEMIKRDLEIAEQKKEEEKNQLEQKLEQRSPQQMLPQGPGQMPGLPGGAQSGTLWYFDNPQAINMGKNDFSRKWGARKLEDNWRLSVKEKENDFLSQNPDSVPEEEGAVENIIDNIPEDRKKYYANIPLTPGQKAVSDSLLLESMFNIAGIYKEKLKDYEAAAIAYEELLKRFPNSKYQAQIYYQLVRVYAELNNKEKSDQYKNDLVSGYPETEFAQVLDTKKPYVTIEEKDAKVVKFYEQTYLAYTQGNYAEVQRRSTKADSMFVNNSLKPKFDYLNALAAARTEGEETFKRLLQEIVVNYPQTEIAAESENILNRLNTRNSEAQPGEGSGLQPARFKMETEKEVEHYFIFIFKKKIHNIDEVKAKFANYNKENHPLDVFEVSSMLLDNDTYMLLVKEFPNKAKAFNYHGRVRLNKEFYQELEIREYDQFIISADNFVELYKTKNIPAYRTFFEKNYPK